MSTAPFNIVGQKPRFLGLADPNRRVVLVTGSRTWTDEGTVFSVLVAKKPTLIVHGACPEGADAIADKVCRILRIPVKRYPAHWENKGLGAGHIRNAEMLKAEKPDYVVAFWDGQSRGTAGCINAARKLGYAVEVYRPDGASVQGQFS